MRLAAYVRVSTKGQAEEGLGLDVQRQAIRKWAKANGHRIAEVYPDESVSGSNGIDQRPALTDALLAIERGQAEGLVAYDLTRLARSLTVQEAALAQVWKLGGKVFTVDQGEVLQDDSDDPMRTFVRQVMGAAAQLERAMIVKRMRAGRRLKADQGGYAYGSPAYGQRAVEVEHEGQKVRALVDDDSEQRAIRRIRELEEGGLSLRQVAAVLEAEGHRPKRGDRWHPQTVARIVGRL